MLTEVRPFTSYPAPPEQLLRIEPRTVAVGRVALLAVANDDQAGAALRALATAALQTPDDALLSYAKVWAIKEALVYLLADLQALIVYDRQRVLVPPRTYAVGRVAMAAVENDPCAPRRLAKLAGQALREPIDAEFPAQFAPVLADCLEHVLIDLRAAMQRALPAA